MVLSELASVGPSFPKRRGDNVAFSSGRCVPPREAHVSGPRPLQRSALLSSPRLLSLDRSGLRPSSPWERRPCSSLPRLVSVSPGGSLSCPRGCRAPPLPLGSGPEGRRLASGPSRCGRCGRSARSGKDRRAWPCPSPPPCRRALPDRSPAGPVRCSPAGRPPPPRGAPARPAGGSASLVDPPLPALRIELVRLGKLGWRGRGPSHPY